MINTVVLHPSDFELFRKRLFRSDASALPFVGIPLVLNAFLAPGKPMVRDGERWTVTTMADLFGPLCESRGVERTEGHGAPVRRVAEECSRNPSEGRAGDSAASPGVVG